MLAAIVVSFWCLVDPGDSGTVTMTSWTQPQMLGCQASRGLSSKGLLWLPYLREVLRSDCITVYSYMARLLKLLHSKVP